MAIDLEKAKSLIGKEVKYLGHESVLTHVRSIENGRMIVGETESKMIINIVLYKIKDENGNWISID